MIATSTRAAIARDIEFGYRDRAIAKRYQISLDAVKAERLRLKRERRQRQLAEQRRRWREHCAAQGVELLT